MASKNCFVLVMAVFSRFFVFRFFDCIIPAVWCSGIPKDQQCYLKSGEIIDPEKDHQHDGGWKCFDETCIPLRLVCEKKIQCADGSDESMGCNLYPETKCTSWHGYEYEKSCTSNNRCFNQISFNESRDCADSIWIECQRLEDWKSPKLNNKKAFHCASGDCIPKTEVCDGIKNCEDGSDEIEGCEAIQDCSTSMREQCKNLTTANWCKKVNHTDMCMCGRSYKCDATGATPQCIDSYGETEPGALDVSGILLPYLRLIDRHICTADTNASVLGICIGGLLILLICVVLPLFGLIIVIAPVLGITHVEKEDSNICELCEKDMNEIVWTKDYKNFELVKYAKKVVFRCCGKQVEWRKQWFLWEYFLCNSKHISESKITEKQYNNGDVEMQPLIKPKPAEKLREPFIPIVSGITTTSTIASIGSNIWYDKSFYVITDITDDLTGSIMFQPKEFIGRENISVFSNKDAHIWIAFDERLNGGLIGALPKQGWTINDGWYVEYSSNIDDHTTQNAPNASIGSNIGNKSWKDSGIFNNSGVHVGSMSFKENQYGDGGKPWFNKIWYKMIASGEEVSFLTTNNCLMPPIYVSEASTGSNRWRGSSRSRISNISERYVDRGKSNSKRKLNQIWYKKVAAGKEITFSTTEDSLVCAIFVSEEKGSPAATVLDQEDELIDDHQDSYQDRYQFSQILRGRPKPELIIDDELSGCNSLISENGKHVAVMHASVLNGLTLYKALSHKGQVSCWKINQKIWNEKKKQHPPYNLVLEDNMNLVIRDKDRLHPLVTLSAPSNQVLTPRNGYVKMENEGSLVVCNGNYTDHVRSCIL